MSAAVIYCRISSDPEGRELGVGRQEEDCRALAARMGLDVVQVYVENDVSASTISTKPRPVYAKMLAEVERGITIISYSNSRLTRRPAEWIELINLANTGQIRIATVASGQHDLTTADGRAVALTIAAWDAAEAERTAERVRRAKAQAAAEGRFRGGRRPFGYEADGMTIRETEAQLIRQATRDVIAGRPLNAIAAEWAGSAVLGRQEKARESTRIRRIIMRARNAGLMERHGEVIGKAAWPAIITEDEHRTLLAVLTNPARRVSPGPTPRNLLSGIATCAICNDGTTLNVASNRGRPTYTCSKIKHTMRNVAVLDAAVIGIVHGLITDPRVIAALTPQEDLSASQADRNRADALRKRLAAAEADYNEGLVNGRQLHEVTQRVEAELAQIAQREAGRMSGSVLGAVANAPDPKAAFDAATLDRRRTIVSALLEVSVGTGGKGRPKGWKPGQPYSDLTNVTITRRTAAGV